MTPNGPPKRAPKDVPPEAARYLDNAAEYLSELVKEFKLELKAYDQYHPDHSAWLHGLYGESNDRQFCIQLITNEEMAPNSAGILKGYVRLYPPDGRNEWLLYETRRVGDMAALMTAAADVTERLRLVCVLRMPHPTDPDPKA